MDNKNNTGNRNTGYWNTGDRNTGNWNTGNWNTGNWNTGDWNTGNWNTGNWNTGDWNTGDRNTGNRNTGDRNTGNWNTGNWNTGDRNTGNWNTGNWNTGDRNTGYFNIDEPKVRIFWKETDIKRQDIHFPSWLYFSLTEWIDESDMTDKQKEDDENDYYKTTWWILVSYDYKEAFKKSYEKATREEQLEVKELPNFDADIFYEISGIRIEDEKVEGITMEQLCKELWREVKIIK